LTSTTCDDGSDPAAMDLAAGETVTCVFTNTKDATITIVKNSVGGVDTFAFTSATLGDFDLTTVKQDADGTAEISFEGLVAGAYDVAETVPADWFLGSATCDDGSDPAAIDLAAGETVTCVFTNFKVLGTAQIGDTVWLDKDKDGVQDADEPGINGAKVVLKDASGTVIATATTAKGPWDGWYKFVGLEAGRYTSSLDLSSVSGELTTAGSFTIDLADGEEYLLADFGVAEELPKTGFSSEELALLAFGLLVLGTLAVLAADKWGFVDD